MKHREHGWIWITFAVVLALCMGCAAGLADPCAEGQFAPVTWDGYMRAYSLYETVIIPFTSPSMMVQGTLSGPDSDEFIYPDTEIQVRALGGLWARVSYNSGGQRQEAYIALADITPNNGSHQTATATGRFSLALRYDGAIDSRYYVGVGDRMELVAERGDRYQVLYPSTGGTYRLAWCSMADYWSHTDSWEYDGGWDDEDDWDDEDEGEGGYDWNWYDPTPAPGGTFAVYIIREGAYIRSRPSVNNDVSKVYDWDPEIGTVYNAYEQVRSEDGTSDWFRIEWNGRIAYVSTKSASRVNGGGQSGTPGPYTEVWAEANQRLATRSGPGAGYTDMGTYYLTGRSIRLTARSWDNTNQIWWVQFAEPTSGQLLWTGSKRFDLTEAQLSLLPVV